MNRSTFELNPISGSSANANYSTDKRSRNGGNAAERDQKLIKYVDNM